MAILTDVFISSPTDVQEYDQLQESEQSVRFPERFQLEGLTNLEFGTLWAIIEHKKFDFDTQALESLRPQDETWLFRLPETFVKILATLTPSAIKKVAPLWADTEELQWEASYAEEVLVELVRLAKIAESSSKGLFFWGSL